MVLVPNTSTTSRIRYPHSVVHTDLSRHVLDAYERTLHGNGDSPYGQLRLFDDKGETVLVYDYSAARSSWLPLNRLQGIDQVREKIGGDVADPPCRYIFIHAPHARAPLGCSRDQLEHILTHHQVMPAFLEHVFTFHAREDAHLQAAFRAEHSLGAGSRIQHCFNLVGVEFDKGFFRHRQTAAYFSLDTSSGRSTWIIIKANNIVGQSIVQSSKKLDKSSQPLTVRNAFSLALRSHLVIFEWAAQNWTPYINKLQGKLSEISTQAGYTPVATMTDDTNMLKLVTRRTGENFGSFPPAAAAAAASASHVAGRSPSWFSRNNMNNSLQAVSPPRGPGGGKSSSIAEVDMTTIFTFDKMQGLYQQATDVVKGVRALEQDEAVMRQMIDYLKELGDSEGLRDHVDHDALSSFLRSGRGYLGQMEAQRNRLTSLQFDLDLALSLYSNILQYNGMRVGEAYAQLAKTSTDHMEDMTRQAKRDTVSIHVITILTLFFLPATFLAVRPSLRKLSSSSSSHIAVWILIGLQTFFSTGIIDFERQEGRSTSHLGDWTVRWGALKLFVVVGVPLTSLVLSAWAFTYFRSTRSPKSS